MGYCAFCLAEGVQLECAKHDQRDGPKSKCYVRCKRMVPCVDDLADVTEQRCPARMAVMHFRNWMGNPSVIPLLETHVEVETVRWMCEPCRQATIETK